MTSQSFTKRQLQITFQLPPAQIPLAAPTFASAPAGTSANTIILTGLRAKALIEKAGGQSSAHAALDVYGMKMSDMNQLSTLGMRVNLVGRSTVQIAASDRDGNFGVVFKGGIVAAYFDASAMPDVAFRVTAQTGLLDLVAPTPPTSFKGSVDIITVLSSIANASARSFQNHGIQPGSIMMMNPYYSGSAYSQVKQIAQEHGINAFIDDQDFLVAMPRDGSTNSGSSDQIPLVSKSTGMIGYPAFTADGIMLRTVYNPSIGFRSQIRVQSDLTPASGTWIVHGLDHNLDALSPKGQWFSDIKAYNPSAPVLASA